MTIQEKITDIKIRLLIDTKKMSKLLEIDDLNLTNFNRCSKDSQDFTIEKFTKLFTFSREEFLDEKKQLDKLSLTKEIDLKKYPNTFKAYSEILKTYFPKPCHVFVVTKIKQRNKFNSFLDLFFNNNKASIINDMKSFSPSFLIEKSSKYLLINFDSKTFKITEVFLNKDKNTFIEGNYKYKKANEIDLLK